MPIQRKITRQVKIGNVLIGGNAPVSIQSMLSVPTKDVSLCVSEIKRLEEAGCNIVRLGIPDLESAEAVAAIKKQTRMPLVADIHFDHRLAIVVATGGADALRINPGNLRSKDKVIEVVNVCRDKNIPIRIGVNGGSIDRTKFAHPTAEALVDSAIGHISILEELKFSDIKVSLKSSDVVTMVEAYRLFSQKRDYPLHVGVTEAGTYQQAVIKSSAGIGSLLIDGIGDTIRVSITGDVVKEVETAKVLLRSLGLRKEGIEIISCPTCARKEIDVVSIAEEFEQKTKNIRKYMKVAIMGCAVNGPGEACEADIGIAVGKTGAVLFMRGKIIKNISREGILDVLLDEIQKQK